MELSILRELDMSDGQIDVYGAVLELGACGLNEIHEKTGIERRHIYDVLNKLIERGFISYIVENERRKFQCTNPTFIMQEIEKKRASLARISELLPTMKALQEGNKLDRNARVYRGDAAIKALVEESLEYSESFWIGGNSSIEKPALKAWWNDYMERRAKQKHIMRDLVAHGTWLETLPPSNLTLHKKKYYKYRQLPPELKSPMVVFIFGNKVAQILWHDQPFAIVLESTEIKDSFLKYFHYFWKEPW